MTDSIHFRKLEKMYGRANVNAIYEPRIQIDKDKTEIEIDVSEKFFHSGGAIHGSVYFKVLDDAAFFAAAAFEKEFFVLTTLFTTYITRPVSSGVLKSVGRVVNQNKSQFIVEAIAFDDASREVARGNGIFVRSKIPLSGVSHYTD